LSGNTLTILQEFPTVGKATAFVNSDAGSGEFHVVKWHLSQENGEVEVKTSVKPISSTVYNPRQSKPRVKKVKAPKALKSA